MSAFKRQPSAFGKDEESGMIGLHQPLMNLGANFGTRKEIKNAK
jgi:hypothetical protein